jgi:hypothetical protein
MKRLLSLTAALLLLASCADNATSLRSKIESATSAMENESGDATKTITYAPTKKPYTIIFFPERRVFETELIARGVDPIIAKRVFHDLSRYGVGEKERPMVVVAEPGKAPAFTSYYGREIVYIDDLIVVNRPNGGEVQMTLQKRGDTYYLTDVH